jgi:uncharacterized protein (TIGR02300 family)
VGEVAKPEWGTKRTCLSCGTKFYDFSREPIVCPSCEAAFKVEPAGRPKRSARPQSKAAPPVAVVAATEEPTATEADDKAAKTKVDDLDVDDEAEAAVEEGDEEVALATEAGLIDDDEDDEDEAMDNVLEAESEEDIEAELNTEIDADFEKESEA